MKLGILFAGQGAQYTGMGKDLYDNYPVAQAVFQQAGSDIAHWCFEGTKQELRQTHITQPSIYTVTMAAYAAFSEEMKRHFGVALPPENGTAATGGAKLEFAGMAGFSLGEYSALTAAGSITDFETGLTLIRTRGQLMTEAGTDGDGNPRGGMAAVFGKRELILSCIAQAREDDILEGVNFNSPIQTVAAGDKTALERLRIRAKETAGLKVVPLSVSTAFHSTMMIPAAEQLSVALQRYTFAEPVVPVYANTTAKEYFADKPEGETIDQWIKHRMAQQVMRPVYWQETVQQMWGDGITTFIEIGPGQTLSGLVKKTVDGAVTLHVEDQASLEATIHALEESLAK